MFYEDLQYDVLGCADINHIFFTTFLHMITENIRETSLVAQRLKRLPPMWETQVQSLDWEDPLEKEMATYSSILAWEIHGHRILASYISWGLKSQTQLSDFNFFLFFLS